MRKSSDLQASNTGTTVSYKINHAFKILF